MLSINVTIVPEMWDEDNELFIEEQTVTLELEHSLVSLSKWESKWKRSFMSSKQEMTAEETIDYIKFMTITPNVDSDVYEKLSVDNVTEINNYIADNQTATTFSDKGGQAVAPVAEGRIVVIIADAGIEADAFDDLCSIKTLEFGIGHTK